MREDPVIQKALKQIEEWKKRDRNIRAENTRNLF
jgi:hypothetical protein